jgi:hypothetical protein
MRLATTLDVRTKEKCIRHCEVLGHRPSLLSIPSSPSVSALSFLSCILTGTIHYLLFFPFSCFFLFLFPSFLFFFFFFLFVFFLFLSFSFSFFPSSNKLRLAETAAIESKKVQCLLYIAQENRMGAKELLRCYDNVNTYTRKSSGSKRTSSML